MTKWMGSCLSWRPFILAHQRWKVVLSSELLQRRLLHLIVEEKMVVSCGKGDTFGELALMYNAPRAATVRAKRDCVLYAVDRMTFKYILMDTTLSRRRSAPCRDSTASYRPHSIASPGRRWPCDGATQHVGCSAAQARAVRWLPRQGAAA